MTHYISNPVRPEFEQYAPSYAELLDDPLRNQFAQDPLHFHRRKCLLIESLLKQAGVTLQYAVLARAPA